MDQIGKLKVWIGENAPMLQGVYQNKYVGMLYDRFASLPPKQQKQTLFGILGGGIGFIVLFLLYSYYSLWSYSSRAAKYGEMVTMLQDYQKTRREKATEIAALQRNSQLSSPGALKNYLLEQVRNASISPRMATVDEKSDAGSGEGKEVETKQAMVSIQKINLSQLKTFLQNVEYGTYNLKVTSLRITNDDKVRGYMKMDIGVVAYLFPSEEGL